MGSVDSSQWREFVISELFDVKGAKSYAMRELEEVLPGTEESINYVVRTKYDNGIKYRVHRRS